MPAFKLPKLPTSLRNLRRSKIPKVDKGKGPAKEVAPTPNNSLDIDNADFELDPSDFNPFGQPDMALTPDGCAPTKSHLDRYSIVESPRQTLSDYLKKLDLKRAKSLKVPSESGASLTRMRRRGSGSFQRVLKIETETDEEPLHHQRVQDLRLEDKSLNLQMARESRPKTDNGKPAPNFERIRGYKVSRRGEEKYPSPQPLKVIRPKPPLLPLREEQECIVPIVMPSFDKPLSSLAESSQGLLRGTSQQLLEPKLIEAPTSLKVVMNTPTRPPMPKTPDSAKSGMGMDSQEDSKGKGKGKAIDEGPQVAYARSAHQRSDSADTKQPTAECERGRPRARKQRAQSNPINRSDSWVLRRGRRSFRSSLDEARTLRSNASTGGHVRVFLKSITNEIELEDGGRLSNIYKDQEELRERILDNHLDIIISELSRRPMPQTIDDLHMNRRLNRNIGKWIKQGVPVRLHDARELKYVSAIQWTLGIEATMSGALAVIEDDGDVKLTLAEKIKLKVKYNRFSRKLRQMDDDPPVSDCPTAQVDRKMCQDRRLRGKRGRDGKC